MLFISQPTKGTIVGIEHIITLLIALAGSAGFWSFMTMREKTRREAATEYQNTLKDQVERLAKKLDTYTEDKEELLREIASLREDLATAKTTINHLETLLRNK
tara:strand:+ start:15767 stop:16075 length:309 start_codon:yes stop_codon:yes gene_type:complete